MEIKGVLFDVFETQVISEKFKKRDFVIKTEGDYPQTILIQVTQTKCELLDKFVLGDQITAHINIRGRQVGNKYYNTIEAWKIS